MHHIGGRAGTRAFPKVPALEHDFVSVMYEASEDGNEQIIQVGGARGTGQTLLVNACVGRPGETRTFNLNHDPFTSSLLELNPNFSNFYMQAEGFDYLMGEAISPIRKELVITESLDEIIFSKSLPACDFLSIDTQGSELEILECAETTLKNCVGIQLEVAFAQPYRGQPQFGEIDNFLKSRGFEFIKFKNFGEYAPRVVGVEGRGEKMQLFADALYFKSARSISAQNFYSLVFTALAYGQTEFAINVASSFGLPQNTHPRADWVKFCDKFLSLCAQHQNVRPTFGQKFSVEASFARFKDTKPSDLIVTDFKSFLRKVFWRSPNICRRLIQKVEVKFRRFVSKRQLKKLRPTKIEELFNEVGLLAVSETLKRSRIS